MAACIFFIIFALTSYATVLASPSLDLVQSSCLNATFPRVCIRTLSIYKGPVSTPCELAQAGIKVSISGAINASKYLSSLRNEADRREKGAVKDCASQIADSVDELRDTLGELKELRRATFRWQMSNALTWVSAALTNEDTYLDGFKEVVGRVRTDVKKRVTFVAKVTSTEKVQ